MERFLKLKEDMNAHAMLDYPRECVGIITNDFKYIPCNNISHIPKHTFILDPVDSLASHDATNCDEIKVFCSSFTLARIPT